MQAGDVELAERAGSTTYPIIHDPARNGYDTISAKAQVSSIRSSC